jgi:hypothetical protein
MTAEKMALSLVAFGVLAFLAGVVTEFTSYNALQLYKVSAISFISLMFVKA